MKTITFRCQQLTGLDVLLYLLPPHARAKRIAKRLMRACRAHQKIPREDMCLDCGIYAGLDLRKTCFVVEVGGQAFEVKAADGTVAARTRGELPL